MTMGTWGEELGALADQEGVDDLGEAIGCQGIQNVVQPRRTAAARAGTSACNSRDNCSHRIPRELRHLNVGEVHAHTECVAGCKPVRHNCLPRRAQRVLELTTLPAVAPIGTVTSISVAILNLSFTVYISTLKEMCVCVGRTFYSSDRSLTLSLLASGLRGQPDMNTAAHKRCIKKISFSCQTL